MQFLEGDPDQPLVVGCVYNDKHMPPYDLPGDKSISGVKSNSTPGGNGFNEFIFDDKDGSELVRLHAQKDLESVIENDKSRNVKKDRKTEDRTKRHAERHPGAEDRRRHQGRNHLRRQQDHDDARTR